jgi:signal-transduction protein with cAMP-binding, CBS, and nucleotidyltransferase domain
MNNDFISSVMQSPAKTIRMDDSVQTAEAFLSSEGLSWAPVVNDAGEAAGVISSDDLIRFHVNNANAATTPVWRLCTYKPVCVSPETGVSTVARLMVERKIHHVLITENNKVQGVVSSLDFLKWFF